MVDEFVDDDVAKVEIDNKEFLGSSLNFFDRGVLFFYKEDRSFRLVGQTMVMWDFTS